MQSVSELNVPLARAPKEATQQRTGVFVAAVLLCLATSATFAAWLPLQVSIVTVFLFAGPHNWFELRYFMQRLPVRFGKSRTFFLTAFVGIGVLTGTYVTMAFAFRANTLPEQWWLSSTATWNTLLLIWIATLAWLRGRQRSGRNWSLAFPIALAVSAINWLAPELFSLSIVYLHPLVALWFLDRHISRHRCDWLKTYRRCLALLPLILALMIWQLSQTPSLANDNGLFWRITQHSGADLFPSLSSHLLVSVHVFLEMLHYAVWLIALPLIGAQAQRSTFGSPLKRKLWDLKAIGVARHPLGYPKLVAALLITGAVAVIALWFGLSVDYATARDVYFTIAISHVLAEAPFLLKML